MKFNLARINDQTKVIKSTDEAFEGTPLEGEGFAIEVKKLKRAEKIDTMSKAVLDDGTISNGEYSKALFISSIQAVSGFVDENEEEITIEDGIAELIWENAPDVLVEEVKKAIQSFNEIEEKKSDIPEQDLTVSQIGQ